jgi:ATP-dependent protease ClpP protease subunit
MYGTINDWGSVSSRALISVLSELAKKYDVINARIHSPGGMVFEADAIGSIIENLKSQGKIINAYIDGMAASAMADLTTYFSRVFISKSGKMMLHQASGSVSGQAQKFRNAADLLDTVNDGMAERFAAKTGKDKKWVLDNWLAVGVDKWFNAQEAIKAGLADELSNDPAKVPANTEAMSELEIIAQYNEIFKPAAFVESPKNQNTLIMNPKLVALLGLLGIAANIQANASDDDLIALIENGIKGQKANLDSISARLKVLEAKQAELEMAEINALIEEKKITTQQADEFRKMIDKVGAEVVKNLLHTFPTPKDLAKEIETNKVNSEASKKGNDLPANKKDWTLEDWEKNDPAGLKAKMKADPEWYNQMFAAQYGE